MGIRSPFRRLMKKPHVQMWQERLSPRRDHADHAEITRPRIFFIGPNKTGTNSFDDWLRRSGVRTVHFGGYEPKNSLAVRMFSNFSARRPILEGIDGYEAYSDLNYNRNGTYLDGGRLFRQLHRDHPDAYFVLNLREVEGWTVSRAGHSNGTHAERMALALGVPVDRLPEIDRELLKRHIGDVRAYFAGTDARFIEFDIERDSPEVLARFLSESYSLDPSGLRRRNRRRPRSAGGKSSPAAETT